jgi:hypothetical protein
MRTAVSALASLSLIVGYVPPVQAGAPQAAAPMTRAGYEACHAGDEQAFRAAVEAISAKALQDGTKGIDYPALVADQWRNIGMDEILDKRVDIAVEEVRSETSWSGLAHSLVSKEKAQALATSVAERVYRSDAVKDAIEALATGVGKEVGRAIEAASRDAAGPALECLRAFLGPRYGSTVAGVVTSEAERDFGLHAPEGGADVSSGAVLKNSTEGMTGAAILLLRRQLANMASRIGQRLAGSVLSRLVSVVAGGVGLVLIAKDIWELRNGVLPIIADEMKSAATKDKVKEELAKTISEQINEHIHEIAAKTADRIVEIWQSFRNAHVKALELAERNPGFKSFLDTVSPDKLARLDEVTALVLASGGEQAVLRRLDDGTLNEAVRFLPEPAMIIARDTRSIDAALKWSALAGDRLDKVLEFEVYRRAEPESFTRSSLAALFALDDSLAITRLSGLDREARERLFDLKPDELKRLARNFSEAELATLSSYLTGLDKAPRERVLAAVANTPGKMKFLSSARVRDAVISSSDQALAVDMMLRDGPGGPQVILTDFRAAYDGRVSPLLMWEKHPVAIVGLALVLLLLLLMLRRLLRPPRVAPEART